MVCSGLGKKVYHKRLMIMIRFLNLVFFAGMIVMNYLANSLPLNDKTTGELSDSFPNLFVPAGITFSIWGVIYLLLLVYCILQFRATNEMHLSEYRMGFRHLMYTKRSLDCLLALRQTATFPYSYGGNTGLDSDIYKYPYQGSAFRHYQSIIRDLPGMDLHCDHCQC